VYFLYAGRGAGKTTFLLQVCSYLGSLGKSVVFFSFDEGIQGIRKKCDQYGLKCLPHFVSEYSPGVIERTLLEHKPDFVVVDSLQSLALYDANTIISTLSRFKKEAQKRMFALVVIGEERKDGTDYLGSTSIGHIVDVLVKMAMGFNEEIIISTPNKNRDTDDKTSRCFFQRTPKGLVEISETQTGYLHRRSQKTAIGLAAFVTKDENDFFVDEMTAALDSTSEKASLTVVGMSSAKAKCLLTVLGNNFLMTKVGFVVRANHTEKSLGDSELACLIAVLSLMLKKPIPVDMVFIGGIDNHGFLLPVEGMEQRVKRARALGYKRIIGPKANGTQITSWEEEDTVEGVWERLGFAE
jgi:DNA repair protein RadA/Sms